MLFALYIYTLLYFSITDHGYNIKPDNAPHKTRKYKRTETRLTLMRPQKKGFEWVLSQINSSDCIIWDGVVVFQFCQPESTYFD